MDMISTTDQASGMMAGIDACEHSKPAAMRIAVLVQIAQDGWKSMLMSSHLISSHLISSHWPAESSENEMVNGFQRTINNGVHT